VDGHAALPGLHQDAVRLLDEDRGQFGGNNAAEARTTGRRRAAARDSKIGVGNAAFHTARRRRPPTKPFTLGVFAARGAGAAGRYNEEFHPAAQDWELN